MENSRYSQITWSQSYHDYDGGTGLQYGINMGYSFAEDWAAENPDKVIGLIVNYQAGCGIDVYEKVPADTQANGYVNTIERVNAALEAGGEFAGIIWHQGESNMNKADYIACYGFASSTAPTMIPSRYATGCYTGSEADYVHFSAKGQIEFGHRFYNAYKNVINNCR